MLVLLTGACTPRIKNKKELSVVFRVDGPVDFGCVLTTAVMGVAITARLNLPPQLNN